MHVSYVSIEVEAMSRLHQAIEPSQSGSRNTTETLKELIGLGGT